MILGDSEIKRMMAEGVFPAYPKLLINPASLNGGESKLTGAQPERLTFLQNDFLVLHLVAQSHVAEPLAPRN